MSFDGEARGSTPRSMGARRAGFTLIELLVVVAIIALLIAILVSALSGAKARGQQVACAANMRQLGQGWLVFAQSNSGFFPGVNNWTGTTQQGTDWKNDWLYGSDGNDNYGSFANPPTTYPPANPIPKNPVTGAYGTGFYAMPYEGTLYPYINSPKPYLCPVLPFIGLNTRTGSNGNHDYSAPQLVSGAKAELMPRSVKTMPMNLQTLVVSTTPIVIPTPILVEESPSANLNNAGAGGSPRNADGAWCWGDQVTTNHMGGTNITSIDASTTLVEPPKGSTFTAQQTFFTLPSGKLQAIVVDNKSSGQAWPFGNFNTN